MATNWTDLVLFDTNDIVLPKVLSGVTGTTNYEPEVKRDFERIINDKWQGVGKTTSDTDDDFDIEEITNGEILKDTALEWNYLLIARFNASNLSDNLDSFAAYYQERKPEIEQDLYQDARQLQFDNPEGVNQLTQFSTRRTR